MYAVIRTGGKQYRVAPGDKLRVEKLTAEPGSIVTFDQVLLAVDGDDVKVGRPLLEGFPVEAEVLREVKGKKVISFKKNKRLPVTRKKGHRQRYTELRFVRVGETRHQPPAEAAPDTGTTEAPAPAEPAGTEG